MEIFQNPTMAAATKIFAQFLPFIIIIAVFYFFLIRPQQKQQQMLAQMRSNLKPGDKIVTKGGTLATVSQIKENTLIVQLYDGAKSEILKNAVISLINA